MLVLTVAKGPDRGAVFELRDRSDFRVVIGRNSPDLKLNDIMISRHHARLKCDGRRWIVRDLGSRNGTKLNGELLQKPTVLKTGDLIKTGYTEFAVKLVPEDERDYARQQGGDASRSAGAESHADVAGAESSGFIDAAIASGEIPHEHAPASKASAAKPKSPVGAAESLVQSADAIDEAPVSAPLDEEPVPRDEPVSISASSVALTEELPDIDEPVRSVAEPKSAPVESPVVAPAAEAPMSERPATEWQSAIESQLVVIDKQGWDDLEEEVDEDGFIAAVTGSADDDEVQPLDDDERSQLYLDEDEHWADDVPLDDEELINSLKEDGPDALLRDLARSTPASTAVAVDVEPRAAKDENGESLAAGGKAKKKRKK